MSKRVLCPSLRFAEREQFPKAVCTLLDLEITLDSDSEEPIRASRCPLGDQGYCYVPVDAIRYEIEPFTDNDGEKQVRIPILRFRR